MFGTKLAARVGVAVALICGALSGAPAQTKPPVEAFAVLPIRPPLISPDGSRFALIRGINGRPAVAVYSVNAPQQPPEIITSSDWLLSDMRWVKNDALILYDRKNMKLGRHDADNANLFRPMGDAAAALLKENKLVRLTAYAQIIDVDLDNPDTIYAIANNSIYSMNIRTGGQPKPYVKHYVGEDKEYADKWFMDGHGKVLARVDSVVDQRDYNGFARRGTDHTWHNTLKILDKDSWRSLGTYPQTVDVEDGIEGVAEDGNSIIRFAPNC